MPSSSLPLAYIKFCLQNFLRQKCSAASRLPLGGRLLAKQGGEGQPHFRFIILNNSAILIPISPLAFPSGESGEHLRADRGLLKFLPSSNPSPCQATARISLSVPQSAKRRKRTIPQKKHHKFTNGSSCFSAAPVVIFIMFPSFSRHCQNIALSSIIRLTAIKFPHVPLKNLQ